MPHAFTYNSNDQKLEIIITNIADVDTIQSLTIDGIEVSTPEFEAAYGDTVEAFVFLEF